MFEMFFFWEVFDVIINLQDVQACCNFYNCLYCCCIIERLDDQIFWFILVYKYFLEFVCLVVCYNQWFVEEEEQGYF